MTCPIMPIDRSVYLSKNDVLNMISLPLPSSTVLKPAQAGLVSLDLFVFQQLFKQFIFDHKVLKSF